MNAAKLDRILRQVLIVPVLSVLIAAAALYWQMHDANRTVALMQSSDASIAQVLLLERLIIDQETGLRGYQTTRSLRFLDPYQTADRQLPHEFERLDELNQAHHAEVDQLVTFYGDWEQGFAVPLIATIQAGGHTDSLELNLQGKLLMEGMRELLLSLNRSVEAEREEHIRRWHAQVRRMSIALGVIATLLGLLIGFYMRTLLKDISNAYRRSNTVLRLRAEEAFHSEQRLRTTLASIGDGVIACDPAGRIETINQVACELTGWTESTAIGQPLETVFHVIREADRAPMEGMIDQIRKERPRLRLEADSLLVRKDGSELLVDDSGAPILDEAGAILGFVIIFRDVTLARKSQQALVANEKLAVAGRLAATIAHEIHNPLDSVANLLFLMNGQSTPEESVQFLELARSEIARVTQISRAMLSLYRESRTPIAIDLKEMLESVLLLLDRRFSDLGVRVDPELPSGLIVHGFPAELRQVFTNLLTNAAEAVSPVGVGPGGKPLRPAAGFPAEVELSVVRLTAELNPAHVSADGLRREAGVIVTVEDEGPGIPESVQPKLFQPFFTTKGEQGTGLGLWVSRGIITKHGGELELASSTDPKHHGTTVSVFLAEHPVMHPGGD